jgi:hypothetical protein
MPAKAGIHALPAIPHNCRRRGVENQTSILSIEKKQALLFCEQKRSKKNFAPAGFGKTIANVPTDQNFFTSPGGQPFFSKKKRFLPSLTRLRYGLARNRVKLT